MDVAALPDFIEGHCLEMIDLIRNFDEDNPFNFDDRDIQQAIDHTNGISRLSSMENVSPRDIIKEELIILLTKWYRNSSPRSPRLQRTITPSNRAEFEKLWESINVYLNQMEKDDYTIYYKILNKFMLLVQLKDESGIENFFMEMKEDIQSKIDDPDYDSDQFNHFTTSIKELSIMIKSAQKLTDILIDYPRSTSVKYVFRGLVINPDVWRRINPGNIHLQTFMSTTVNLNVAKGFTTLTSSPVILIIRIPEGDLGFFPYISNCKQHKNCEAEVLLFPGIKLKLCCIFKINGITYFGYEIDGFEKEPDTFWDFMLSIIKTNHLKYSTSKTPEGFRHDSSEGIIDQLSSRITRSKDTPQFENSHFSHLKRKRPSKKSYFTSLKKIPSSKNSHSYFTRSKNKVPFELLHSYFTRSKKQPFSKNSYSSISKQKRKGGLKTKRRRKY
jgi:hypothetical protein